VYYDATNNYTLPYKVLDITVHIKATEKQVYIQSLDWCTGSQVDLRGNQGGFALSGTFLDLSYNMVVLYIGIMKIRGFWPKIITPKPI